MKCHFWWRVQTTRGRLASLTELILIVQDKRMNTVALWRILLTLLELPEINKRIKAGVYALTDCVASYSIRCSQLIICSWTGAIIENNCSKCNLDRQHGLAVPLVSRSSQFSSVLWLICTYFLPIKYLNVSTQKNWHVVSSSGIFQQFTAFCLSRIMFIYQLSS